MHGDGEYVIQVSVNGLDKSKNMHENIYAHINL